MGTTPEECLDALREAARRLDESPTKNQYEELGLTPASATVIRVVGGWNDAKEQASLETCSSTGTRVQPKPDDVTLPDGEAWGDLSVDQRWHYRNVEWNTERTLERRRRLRKWLRIHRASRGCERCGETNPGCLDFHHVRGEKERAVNEMVTYGYSAAAIHAELQKCDILCANCHRAEHVGVPDALQTVPADVRSLEEIEAFLGIGDERQPEHDGDGLTKAERLRTWTVAYRSTHGCQRCSVSDPSCLEFHHPDSVEKEDGIAAMIADSRPEADVVTEVDRCTVLCANCHRTEHEAEGTWDDESDRI